MLTYVAGTVGRLEESIERGFRETRGALDDLRRESVTKREHDELKARVAQIEAAREQARRDREAAEAQAARDQLAADRQARRDARTDRWQRIGLAAGTCTALLGTAAGVVLHFT